MQARIVIKRAGGQTAEEQRLLSFGFVKEAYTPYTSLTAKVKAESGEILDIAEVSLYVGDTLVHHGLSDSAEYTDTSDGAVLTIHSKGFTSLLCRNQLEPGLKTDISVNSLMDSFYTLPFVTHEDNSDTSGYIYVKSGATLWDGVANLSYKQSGMYPYIRGTNCVRITQEQSPVHFQYSDSELISKGRGSLYSRLVSYYHMGDLNGEYGGYELLNSNVMSFNIVRHVYFELDRQFLYDPQQALEYRNKYSARASVRYFCRYCGYKGEDLCDTAAFGEVTSGRIGRIEITGNSSGIVTEISVYSDGFYTAVTS